MNFKTFYSILFNRIGDTLTSGEFVRDLIAMITSVPEEELGLKKDPSNRVSLKTFENFPKRGINKTTCKAIVYRLTPDNFIDSLNSRPKATLELLANDLLSYDSSATSDNVANKLADIFVSIVREGAGLVSPDNLKEQKQLQSSSDLKAKYGKYLLQECGNHCVMDGCSNALIITNGTNVSEVYEISPVIKSDEPSIDNLVALCPQCFATYQMDNNKNVTKVLKKRKKALANHMENISLLSSSQLEKGLTDVITRISKLKQKDLFESSLDPKELREKIDPDIDIHLYMIAKQQVTTYYIKTEEILINLDKRNVIDYEDLQSQMRSIYKKLNKSKRNKIEIFEEISDKIHRVTLQNPLYCQIIVSYFIQKCEVFDAITK